MRRLLLLKQAQSDLAFWRETNPQVFARLTRLLQQIVADPFHGIGKPEPLKYELAGHWSRRITQEHRLVYRVEGDAVIVVQCRFHYE